MTITAQIPGLKGSLSNVRVDAILQVLGARKAKHVKLKGVPGRSGTFRTTIARLKIKKPTALLSRARIGKQVLTATDSLRLCRK